MENPKRILYNPVRDTPLFIMSLSQQKQDDGHPKNCTAQTREELKNEPESKSWNDVNSKQVKEEPADPETNEMCHVTKFGNWEFEGLKAFVKRERESRA